MKIGMGINCWDEPDGILRILQGKNVYEFFDNIIIIEGRYEGRNDEATHDHRIMDEIPRSFDKVIYERLENAKQIDKRNSYWDIAYLMEYDWFLVVDSDETVEVEPDKFRAWLEEWKDYDARCFPVSTITFAGVMARPRLFRKPGGIRHKDRKTGMINHGSLWDESDREVIPDMYRYHKKDRGYYRYVEGLYMKHDKKYRSVERIVLDEVYYTQNPTR